MAVLEQPPSESTHAESVRTIDVKSPFTGERIGQIPVHSHTDIAQAVAKARAAQPAWSALSVKARARILRRWHESLWQEQSRIIETIRRETGKSYSHALAELGSIIICTEFFCNHGPRALLPQRRKPTFPLVYGARVIYKPYGVAGFITPWNYPLLNGLMDCVPALIAGNSVVLKPSEITPFTAQLAVELMRKAGVPHDVVQIVNGDGSTGEALIDYVDSITFTGSTAVGRKVAVRAAERLIPVTLEMGGKDPLIVLKDADLDMAAVGTLLGALENCGQACVGTERIYIEQAVYEPFLERLIHYTSTLKLGAEDDASIHIGSMTNEREIKRCEAQIADAIARGAKVVYGGNRRPDLGPLFFEPTILIDVTHDMAVMHEETFGPLIPVMRVANAEEALMLANDNEYGLSATLYTSNLRKGSQLAERIDSGDVGVNRPHMIFGTPSLPFGGLKPASGVGRRNGIEGLLRYTRPQSIFVDRLHTRIIKRVLGAEAGLRDADLLTMTSVRLLRRLWRYVPFLRP